jgi:hypothetical protein
MEELYAGVSEAYQKNIADILTTLLRYLTYNFDFLRWGYGTEAFEEKQVERLRK